MPKHPLNEKFQLRVRVYEYSLFMQRDLKILTFQKPRVPASTGLPVEERYGVPPVGSGRASIIVTSTSSIPLERGGGGRGEREGGGTDLRDRTRARRRRRPPLRRRWCPILVVCRPGRGEKTSPFDQGLGGTPSAPSAAHDDVLLPPREETAATSGTNSTGNDGDPRRREGRGGEGVGGADDGEWEAQK